MSSAQKMEKNDRKLIMSYVYNDILEKNPSDYYSQSVKKTKNALNEVSPPYLVLNQNGTLEKTNSISRDFIEEMHKKSIKVVPFLTDQWDQVKARAALKNKIELVSEISKTVKEYGLDGVNVDIEHVTEKDRKEYSKFVESLRKTLPKNKKVTVAIAANPNGWKSGWHGAYDDTTLAKYSDYLMLMAYDEHTMNQENPGPVASFSFVETSIKSTLSRNVPAEKIVLGIPFYGRIWKEDGAIQGLDVSLKMAENLIEKYNGKVVYNQTYQTPKATFTISRKDDLSKLEKWDELLTPGTYTLWFENEKSIKSKLKLVQKYHLKGIGIWSLGQEPESTWDYLEQSLN